MSRVEYEIACGSLFDDNSETKKISIYDQVKPNLGVLAKYIIDEYNKGG